MESNPLFDQLDRQSVDLWDRILISQVDYTFDLELSAFYHASSWHTARNVLDLGTGNGYYLHRLAQRFKDKHYCGVDLIEEAIDIAQARYATRNVAFQVEDLFHLEGQYEFIVLRAVVQHVSDLKNLVRCINRLLTSGGSAIIVETDDRYPFYAWPATPQVSAMFEALTQTQLARQEATGSMLDDFVALINDSQLSVCRDQVTVVPTTIQDNLRRLRDQFRMIIELLRQRSNLTIDFDQVHHEWERWCETSGTYGELRLRILEVRK